MRLAIAGVGNNAAALAQGIAFYGSPQGQHLPGVTRPWLCGIHVTDVEIVAAFETDARKTGRPFTEAIFAGTNNYPMLPTGVTGPDPVVLEGITDPDHEAQIDRVADQLRDARADVLLYSLPTGLPQTALAYAHAAIRAGVHLVNCTPDPMARDEDVMKRATKEGVRVVGDDLQSHLGSSVVHGALLELVQDRGLTLSGSYQVNFGGNADFQNLVTNGSAKEHSKHNALRQRVADTGKVTVIPSGGFVPYLEDRKVAHISIEGRGWADTPVKLDVALGVQDSSNAAGVIIDLVRIAAAHTGAEEGGFPLLAAPLLKSAPIEGDVRHSMELARSLLEQASAQRNG
ncbi:hypothetical protein [Streptomyces sp. NBC_01431]|uniref:hypothetical protein n=1 Tax=Streptomyces sp. NBC_01431 TaxID=2903863 RepID=UPI002E37C003|nr:hypothetical protein [Streptomyces sp. NBC_01431]